MNETSEQQWIYAGRRWNSVKNRVIHVWVDPDGNELFYLKTAGAVGGLYTVNVTTDHTLRGTPEFVGPSNTDATTIGTWQVRDKAAYAQQQRYRLEQSLKRTSEVDNALGALLRIAERLPALADREALASYVRAKIHSA